MMRGKFFVALLAALSLSTALLCSCTVGNYTEMQIEGSKGDSGQDGVVIDWTALAAQNTTQSTSQGEQTDTQTVEVVVDQTAESSVGDQQVEGGEVQVPNGQTSDDEEVEEVETQVSFSNFEDGYEYNDDNSWLLAGVAKLKGSDDWSCSVLSAKLLSLETEEYDKLLMLDGGTEIVITSSGKTQLNVSFIGLGFGIFDLVLYHGTTQVATRSYTCDATTVNTYSATLSQGTYTLTFSDGVGLFYLSVE
jgi:hypothetical protein